MRMLTAFVLLALFSACTHEPDYSPTGVSGPDGDYVAFISPSHGQSLTGFEDYSVSVSASAGVDNVEFYIDNQYQTTDWQSPYRYTWPTHDYSGGSHKIKAIGRSMGQTLDTDQVTVKLERKHIYVDDDAGPHGVGKDDDPTQSFSVAAFLSSAGDTIYVASGDYNDSYETDTPYGTKTVSAMLAGGVSVIGEGADNTMIDCTGSDIGIFYGEGQAGGLIKGVSIMNAGEACIFITDSEPRIERCVIAESHGNGIMLRDSERTITKIVYSSIESNAGSGIYMNHADLQVYYSFIRNNGDAGVYCERWAFPRLRMVRVSGNNVGIFVDAASTPNVTRCDVFDNESYNVELGHGHLLETLYFREIWWEAINRAEIEEKIYHQVDDPALALVDYGRWLSNPIFPQPE